MMKKTIPATAGLALAIPAFAADPRPMPWAA